MGRETLLEKRAGAEIEDVPPYTWRTPLQRAIQILKRHRDVMFVKTPDLAPISMIITNLAAHAYGSEHDLAAALSGIVARMGNYVQVGWPKVPNPTHPAEDYADKWRRQPELERQFYLWLTQVQADVRTLSTASPDARLIEKRFALRLSEEQERQIAPPTSLAFGAPLIVTPRAVTRIDSAPRPWGEARAAHSR